MKFHKFLTACGNGMGTSMIIKIKLENVLDSLGVEDYVVESCAAGMAQTVGSQYDVIMCSDNLADELEFPNSDVKVLGIRNVMDENEIRQQLEAVIKANASA